MKKLLTRREFLRSTAVLSSATVWASKLSIGAEAVKKGNDKRPNIIFLMSDQQRWDCVGKINPMVKTPALDRIVDNGILFDQAVCQGPMCVPSRYSMMLGLYPSQVGVLKNSMSLTDDKLPCETLPEILRKAGYQTAGFGKTHWRAKGCSTRGFETRFIGQPRNSSLYERDAVMMSDVNPEGLGQYMQETRPFGAGEENIAGYLGCTSKVQEKDHRDGWVFNECLHFIENGIDKERPLFLYLSFLKPHAGHNVPPGYEELYEIDKIPVPEQLADDYVLDNRSCYCECCSNIAHSQWNHRLNLLHGDAAYADVVEIEAYNAGLAGISLKGTEYFYANKLAVGKQGRSGPHSGVRERYIWAGGIIGMVAGGMISFIVFKIAIMLFSSVGGSALMVVGTLAVMCNEHVGREELVKDLVLNHNWFLPVALIVPAVVGIILQNKFIKGSRDWSV